MSITRSMRSCRLARMCSVCARPLAAERRHSRMAATNSADMGSGALVSRRSNRVSSEPPDQKDSSNCLAWLRSLRRRSDFSKMIAQVQNEAANSISITSLTIVSAWRNRLMTDILGGGTLPASAVASSGTVGVAGSVGSIGLHKLLGNAIGGERHPHRLRQALGPTLAVETGDANIEAGEQVAAALNALIEPDDSAPHLDHPRFDGQEIVELGRHQVIDLAAADGEGSIEVLDHFAVTGAGIAHHLGARAFGEFQIIGVIDDAGGVRILIIDANGKAMDVRHRCPPPPRRLRPGDQAAARVPAPPIPDSDSRRPSASARAACAAADLPGSDKARSLLR